MSEKKYRYFDEFDSPIVNRDENNFEKLENMCKQCQYITSCEKFGTKCEDYERFKRSVENN